MASRNFPLTMGQWNPVNVADAAELTLQLFSGYPIWLMGSTTGTPPASPPTTYIQFKAQDTAVVFNMNEAFREGNFVRLFAWPLGPGSMFVSE